jgi:putative endonuclease
VKNPSRTKTKSDGGAPWYVYMLECADGSIYTGISNDVEARLARHNSGKGAKYTSGRRPVTLKAVWTFQNKVQASQTEFAWKQLPREKKLQLISECPLR